MKGLKNKMSIKAFCKRGLAIMLACAMVAPGLPALNVRADETTNEALTYTVVESLSSTTSEGSFAEIMDHDPTTHWQSQNKTAKEYAVVLDLGATKKISRIDYTPRFANQADYYWWCNGNIKDIAIDISTDETVSDSMGWVEVVASHEFLDENGKNYMADASYTDTSLFPANGKIEFTTTEARYIRIRANDVVGRWGTPMTIGDLDVYEVEEKFETLKDFASSDKEREILVTNAKSNSEQPDGDGTDGPAGWAFDANENHWWHSCYNGSANGDPSVSPIWIQSGFDKVWAVKEIHYAPRNADDARNVIGDYMVQVACLDEETGEPSESDFVTVKVGEMPLSNEESTIDLGAYYRATHVRLVALSKQGEGSVHVTARLISFYGKDIDSNEMTPVGYGVGVSPLKTLYHSDETLDTTGVYGKDIYADNTAKAVSLSTESFEYDFRTSGRGDVTANYNGATGTYKVDVIGAYDNAILADNAKANSEQLPVAWNNDGGASWAFDGDTSHWWHSRYQNWDQKGEHEVGSQSGDGKPTTDNPIWLQTGFNKAWMVKEITYLPRDNGHGVINEYKILVANITDPTEVPKDTDFIVVKEDRLKHSTDYQSIMLEEAVEATHIRIVVTDAHNGGNAGDGHVAARDIKIYGYDSDAAKTAVAKIDVVEPTKLSYVKGTELDTTGMNVTVRYRSGDFADVTAECTVEGYDNSKLGVQELSVKFNDGVIATYNVTVLEAFDSTVLAGNAKANSEQLPVAWDNDGGAGWAFDGDTSHWWHSRYQNWDQKGEHEVGSQSGDGKPTAENPIWLQTGFNKAWMVKEITYLPRDNGHGVIHDYKILVANITDPTQVPKDTDFEEVKKDSLNYSTDYQLIMLKEAVEATHIRIVVTDAYNLGDGGEGDGHVAARDIKIYGYDSDAAKTAVAKIEVTTPPIKVEYIEGEELDTKGMVVTATYRDGSTVDVTADCIVTGFESSVGVKSLTVTFENVTATFDVNVVENLITKGANWINVRLEEATIVNGLSVPMTEDTLFNEYEVYVSTKKEANWPADYVLVCEGTWDKDIETKTTAFKTIAGVHQVRLIAADKEEVEIAEPTILTADTVTEWCSGGSLRMDAKVPNPEEDPYGATSLRFVYVFPTEMNGLKLDTTNGSWYWNYATEKEDFATESIRKDVENGKWLINDEKKLVQSNIVFKDILRKQYERNLYTTLTVTYSDGEGGNSLTVYDTMIAERSVKTVATLLKEKYNTPENDAERAQFEYANGILGNQAQ